MQGGQGDVKHWAFNDPLPREGRHKDAPPPPAEYRKLATRVVDLHPLTIAQNARTSGGGNISLVPTKAITRRTGRDLEGGEGVDLARRQARQPVRPAADRADDLEADRRLRPCRCRCWPIIPNVQFNYYRGGIGRARWRCTDADPTPEPIQIRAVERWLCSPRRSNLATAAELT